MLNYGPLKSLLTSEDMTEIMVNSWQQIFVEHRGCLVKTAVSFIDARALEDLIYAILLQDKKDYTKKLQFDGMLPEGHRYNITLPPLSPKGPTLTIRKFFEKNFSMSYFVNEGFLSEKASHFLSLAIAARLNIIVSGGTGTGKTSLLNTLASLIPEDQRVVSIEDTQELRPMHSNWIYLQTVKQENHTVSAKECVSNSLRMRPDRIIVGECRGAEAFDMLQAMNTGHNGSMTSLHANSASDALTKLELLIGLGRPELSTKVVRAQINQAVDIVVQLSRNSDGKRELLEIVEITGMEGDIISRSQIFSKKKNSVFLDVTGYVPRVLDKINQHGALLSARFFDPQFSFKKSA